MNDHNEIIPEPAHPRSDADWMRFAIELARRGEGHVEPNPMVGCLVVSDGKCISSGFHAQFGGPHAEVAAMGHLDKEQLSAATVYVTLEPCCHFGKTPPCVDLLLAKPPKRVVVALEDPFPKVAGQGIARLRAAGIEVEVGVEEAAARRLLRPYLKRLNTGLPWVIAKWAMTLDGRIATHQRDSQWISNAASRQWTHQLRGRMDAIIVGIGTALADDPLLTARPSGARVPIRVIFDRSFRLPLHSQLLQTLDIAPVWVVGCDVNAPPAKRLANAGCQLVACSDSPSLACQQLLEKLAHNGSTNVLVEGGASLLGSFFDARLIDEVHVFIGNHIIGGDHAISPIGGTGAFHIREGLELKELRWEFHDDDAHASGIVHRKS